MSFTWGFNGLPGVLLKLQAESLSGAITQSNRYAILLISNLTNSIDLDMNDLWYNNLKMLFVLIVSIVILFTKKLDAQAKPKLKMEYNMEIKNHHYQVI